MGAKVIINGVTYSDVPEVKAPLADGGGDAHFYFTGDDTAVSEDVLTGKTAHTASGAISGGMVNHAGENVSIADAETPIKIPKGYHDGNGSAVIADAEKEKLISANIKKGVSILGVAGSTTVVDTADADATAATVKSGTIAYAKGVKITGTLTAATVAQDPESKVVTIS